MAEAVRTFPNQVIEDKSVSKASLRTVSWADRGSGAKIVEPSPASSPNTKRSRAKVATNYKPALSWQSFTLVLFNVVLYSIAHSMWAPLQPYVIKNAGGNTSEHYGLFVGTASFMSMVGALLGGPFVDRHGQKLGLLISFAASWLSYTLAASSSSMFLLYLSRLPLLFQQALLASRSYVAVKSDGDAVMLGYVNIAYGLGATTGPAIGAILVKYYSESTAILFAASLSIVSFVLTLFGMTKETVGRSHSRRKSYNTVYKQLGLRELRQTLSRAQVRYLLLLKIFVNQGSAVFHSMLPLVLAEQFGLMADQNGFVFSYMGVVVVIAQLMMHGLRDHCQKHQRTWTLAMLLNMAVAFMAMTQCRNTFEFCVVATPLMMSATTLFSINTAALSKAVGTDENGSILGIDMGLSSFQRVLAPLIGSFIVYIAGLSSIGWGSGVCAALSIVFVLSVPEPNEQTDKSSTKAKAPNNPVFSLK